WAQANGPQSLTADPRIGSEDAMIRLLPKKDPRAAGAAVLALTAAGLIGLTAGRPARAGWVWVEGEKPVRSTMHRHPWWYDKVKRDQLSGGDFISNFAKEPGEASYAVNAPAAGSYEFWVRANPIQSQLSYRLNGGPWTPVDMTRDQQGNTNI